MQKQIVLIMGPKNSGKSQCAKALQKEMNWDMADIDDLITWQNGKTPRELYLEDPELFKEAEAMAFSSALNSETERNGIIISAGGGLIDNAKAIKLLLTQKERIKVFLDVSAECAWQRISNSSQMGGLPPFLDKENPRESHLELHRRRAKEYKAMADIIINAENKTPETLAKEIVEKLKNYSAKIRA